MSKRRKKKGLLADQKPKRRWVFLARFAKPVLLLLAAALVIFLGFRISSNLHISLSSLQKQDERPQLSPIDAIEPSEEDKIRISYRKQDQVDASSMRSMAVQIQEGLGLRKIDLIQTTPYKIMIASHPFVPTFVAELDSLRYVSEDGIIFGRAPESESSNLPLLRGLDRKAPMNKNNNGTFVTSSGNQRIIEEALLAVRIGQTHQVHFRTLQYDDFRGLSGEILDPPYRVILGFKPFESKYLKLDKILGTLRQRGITSASIELDYKGKAFVKESVL